LTANHLYEIMFHIFIQYINDLRSIEFKENRERKEQAYKNLIDFFNKRIKKTIDNKTIFSLIPTSLILNYFFMYDLDTLLTEILNYHNNHPYMPIDDILKIFFPFSSKIFRERLAFNIRDITDHIFTKDTQTAYLQLIKEMIIKHNRGILFAFALISLFLF